MMYNHTMRYLFFQSNFDYCQSNVRRLKYDVQSCKALFALAIKLPIIYDHKYVWRKH